MFSRFWNWFVGLNTLTRILILASFVIFGFLGSLTETSEETSTSEVVATESPTPTSSASPTPDESVSPEPSPSPETPLEFRFSALRDLDDLRKDVKDAREGITQEGLGKFNWNLVEIQFNLSQLERLLPREAYAEDWNAKLSLLSKAVADIDTDDENLTISSAKVKLDKILAAIPPLEKIAKSLAN